MGDRIVRPAQCRVIHESLMTACGAGPLISGTREGICIVRLVSLRTAYGTAAIVAFIEGLRVNASRPVSRVPSFTSPGEYRPSL